MTSNTLQFGGRFRLEASVEVLLTTYTAEGWFGINVLLVFKPFKIVAGASAGVSISAGEKELFGVRLRAHLEGPEPWYATGRATFTFFGLDVDFGFDIGTRPGGEPRDSHDVAEDVVLALQAADAWQAVESSDAWAIGVITGDELPAGLWVRPDQEIEARQPVAPLNRTITAFGELVPEDDRIDATDVKVGGAVVPAPEWLDDWFAPAQFDRLDDTSRLSSPSYELMTAGVRFGAAGIGISADPDRECTTVSREPETSVFPDADGKLSRFVSPARPAAAPAVRRTVRGVPLAVEYDRLHRRSDRGRHPRARRGRPQLRRGGRRGRGERARGREDRAGACGGGGMSDLHLLPSLRRGLVDEVAARDPGQGALAAATVPLALTVAGTPITRDVGLLAPHRVAAVAHGGDRPPLSGPGRRRRRDHDVPADRVQGPGPPVALHARRGGDRRSPAAVAGAGGGRRGHRGHRVRHGPAERRGRRAAPAAAGRGAVGLGARPVVASRSTRSRRPSRTTPPRCARGSSARAGWSPAARTAPRS